MGHTPQQIRRYTEVLMQVMREILHGKSWLRADEAQSTGNYSRDATLLLRESLRNTARSLRMIGVEVSPRTILRWIDKYTGLMERYLQPFNHNYLILGERMKCS
jgi:hypothetical protein